MTLSNIVILFQFAPSHKVITSPSRNLPSFIQFDTIFASEYFVSSNATRKKKFFNSHKCSLGAAHHETLLLFVCQIQKSRAIGS